MGWLETLNLKKPPQPPLAPVRVEGALKVHWQFRIAEIQDKTVRILWWDGKQFNDVELTEGDSMYFSADLIDFTANK